jgi:glycerate kinase
MNGKFVSGADLFAEAANLDERLKTADLLISGEGAIDAQSLMGKGVGSLFARAKQAGVNRLGLAGILGSDLRATDHELQLLSIVPGLANPEEAKRNATHWLAKLAAQAAKNYEV